MIDQRWEPSLDAATPCVPFRRARRAARPPEAVAMATPRAEAGFLAECPDLVLGLDAEGRIAFANPAWEAALGWAPRELAGTAIATLVPAEDRPLAEDRLGRLALGDDLGLHEWRLVHRDGGVRVLEGRLRATDGGLRGILRDVTERHAREAQREQALGAVSHDLRTPLGSLKLAVDFLLSSDAVALPELAREILGTASRSVERMIRLTDDLTARERVLAGQVVVAPEPVVADRLLTEAGLALAPLAREAGVAIVVRSAPLAVLADPDRLAQVLSNLLGNALKFSPAGTVGELAAEAGPDGQATFRVADQGRGIPAHLLEAVFERYVQVDPADARAHGGLGLGLPIARRLVEAHGGRLWAESEPGRGATLVFTLPLA